MSLRSDLADEVANSEALMEDTADHLTNLLAGALTYSDAFVLALLLDDHITRTAKRMSHDPNGHNGLPTLEQVRGGNETISKLLDLRTRLEFILQTNTFKEI
jgi:hypothetical protein